MELDLKLSPLGSWFLCQVIAGKEECFSYKFSYEKNIELYWKNLSLTRKIHEWEIWKSLIYQLA